MESGSPEDAHAASEDDYVQGGIGALSSNRLINCCIYSYYCIKKDMSQTTFVSVLSYYIG